MSKLKKGDNQADHGWQCDRVIYGEHGEFEVYAVRENADGYKPWRMRLIYPTAGASSSGVVQPAHWSTESLMDAMQRFLRRVRATYGGSWYLDIRHHVFETDDRIVPATAQQKTELRRRLDAIIRPNRVPVAKIEPPEKFAGLLREEPGATEPDEPTGHVVLTGEIPAADDEFFNRPASGD